MIGDVGTQFVIVCGGSWGRLRVKSWKFDGVSLALLENLDRNKTGKIFRV